MVNRGQAHTLEGVAASLIVLSAMVFAIQMTAVTPLTASTSSQHIENQLQATAKGVLVTASETGSLRRAMLYWNNSSKRFHDTNDAQGYYTNDPPDNDFGDALSRAFDSEGIAYNVYLHYAAANGDRLRRRYVYRGVPSDNAISASHAVTLTDDDALYDDDGTRNATANVANSDSFYAPDTGDDRSLYNVVRVEVVAWRI